MTTPETPGKAGVQLDDEELFLRQQRFVTDKRPAAGPLIIAIGMRTPENMGSILRHADAAGCPEVFVPKCCSWMWSNVLQRKNSPVSPGARTSMCSSVF